MSEFVQKLLEKMNPKVPYYFFNQKIKFLQAELGKLPLNENQKIKEIEQAIEELEDLWDIEANSWTDEHYYNS